MAEPRLTPSANTSISSFMAQPVLPANVRITFSDEVGQESAFCFVAELGLNAAPIAISTPEPVGYDLHFQQDGVRLQWLENRKKLHFLNVDFVHGANAHRRLYGGGKSQAIAKALGVDTKFKPNVLDATAGQGGDAFVLASLGCKITMFERSPVAFALLQSALTNALGFVESDQLKGGDNDDFALAETINRMSLQFRNLADGSSELVDQHDCVYLDPMFPERKKTAAVKKEMRVFHDVIGADPDSDKLLECARDVAKYRVVVKRSKSAPFLNQKEPTYQLKGKSTRFDIYVNKAIAK